MIDRQQQETERNRAIMELEEHYKDVFYDKDILGGNYYEALDIYLKDENVPEFNFDAKICRILPREEYLRLYSIVEDTSKHYDVLTNKNEHSLYKNPWYGLNPNKDADAVYQRYQLKVF